MKSFCHKRTQPPPPPKKIYSNWLLINPNQNNYSQIFKLHLYLPKAWQRKPREETLLWYGTQSQLGLCRWEVFCTLLSLRSESLAESETPATVLFHSSLGTHAEELLCSLRSRKSQHFSQDWNQNQLWNRSTSAKLLSLLKYCICFETQS